MSSLSAIALSILSLSAQSSPTANGKGLATGTVRFIDIASNPASGLSGYHRTPSPRTADAEAFYQASLTTPMTFQDLMNTPIRFRGMPGLALFDYDNDGDLDLYVANGPGSPNSLFANQLVESGALTFVDVAAAAGVEASEQDSNGVCFGDIDNDGDHDLFVVADAGAQRLYRNNGDGTFSDISANSGVRHDGIAGNSCAFGDINNDGLIDLFVTRGWPQDTLHACFLEPFHPDIAHNELYLNAGHGRFVNVSETSGVRDTGGLPPWAAGSATITWTASLVDYDQDGDVDLITADDQCGLPNENFGGINRGFLQIFENDGTGRFTNRTVEAGTNRPSGWMGLTFGDFNHDRNLDLFGASFGDWGKRFMGAPIGIGDLNAMPFGWGASARDFDNDGDTDIVFHGGLDLFFIVDKSNPGSMLLNNGNARFGLDRQAFTTNHSRRNVSTNAAGDLNNDGFVDIVTVSNFDLPEPIPLLVYGQVDPQVDYGSVYDPTAYFTPVFNMVAPGQWAYSGMTFPDGGLTVEINSADNGNGHVAVKLVGTAGLTASGRVNRDALGAVVVFTPHRGKTALAPVLGGSSHLSQETLTQHFGLAHAAKGTLDILWPGGTRNRVYNVHSGERLQIPELPCSYDTEEDLMTYRTCVDRALDEIEGAGLADAKLRGKMRASAMRAYRERGVYGLW